jgi:hypothetical protein
MPHPCRLKSNYALNWVQFQIKHYNGCCSLTLKYWLRLAFRPQAGPASSRWMAERIGGQTPGESWRLRAKGALSWRGNPGNLGGWIWLVDSGYSSACHWIPCREPTSPRECTQLDKKHPLSPKTFIFPLVQAAFRRNLFPLHSLCTHSKGINECRSTKNISACSCCSFPDPFQHLIHWPLYHPTLYSLN